MNLSILVKNFFKSDPKFYKNTGEPIEPNIILGQYFKIKDYFLKSNNSHSKKAIFVEKDYLYVLLILACIETGITFIPLNKKWPLKRVREILELCEDVEVICDDSYASSITEKNMISLQSILSNQSRENRIQTSLEQDLDNIAYIIFTSGSTGKPKGVKITRDSYLNFVNWVGSFFNDINASDKLLNTAEFTFDLSLIDIALLLTRKVGFQISLFDGNAFKLLNEIQSLGITVMATVPNNFQLLLTEEVRKRGDLSSLKHLLVGGARFSFGLYKKIGKYLKHSNVYNLYGPTEATVYCSAKRIEFQNSEVEDGNISAGKEVDNCEIRIVDQHNKTLPEGQIGRVIVGGAQVMMGYLNDEEQNDKILLSLQEKIFYDTGDEGFKSDQDNLYIVGRSDDTIKVEGFRVNLSEIDSLIQRLDYIEECATISMEDEIKENVLVAYINSSKDITSDKLISDLSEFMLTYQIPKRFEFIDSFPLNSSGKISKLELKKLNDIG